MNRTAETLAALDLTHLELDREVTLWQLSECCTMGGEIIDQTEAGDDPPDRSGDCIERGDTIAEHIELAVWHLTQPATAANSFNRRCAWAVLDWFSVDCDVWGEA